MTAGGMNLRGGDDGDVMNLCDKIISNNISTCLRYKHFLTEWEISFVESVNGQEYPLSQKQFNRLNEIREKVDRELLGLYNAE